MLAAGGVLWRRDVDGVRVAVIHRPKYDDWSLPKGKLDPGEPAVVGAVREVAEETGFTACVGRTLGQSRYRVLDRGRDVQKTVRWWAMQVGAGEFVPTAEVDRLDWLDVERAHARITAGRDAGVLQAFVQHPPDTALVLLLRHASAGRGETWPGPDDERPLDALGLAQARAACAVLAAYGPDQVLSAPATRCVQTVLPLAEQLGQQVTVDPGLSERARGQLVPTLREVATRGRRVVVCSQGGVIPLAVEELAVKAGLDVGPVHARKGSLWALSLCDGELVDADYTDDLLG